MSVRLPLAVSVFALGLIAVGATTRLRPADVPPPLEVRQTTASGGLAFPEPSRRSVDVTMPVTKGRRIDVAANGNLQAALNEAQPGDVIALDPNGTYKGPFRLPKKDGTDWIVITSAAADRLPPPGQRVSARHARLMPKLRGLGRFVMTAAPGAHHYRLVGLDLAPPDGGFVYALLQLGDDEGSADDVPHHMIVDRCYLSGDPARGSRRGVAMNGADMAVVDSYVADFKEAGADSQAIAGWNGPGPFRIANNYLEAAGENIMFGGADPSIPDLVPSDIEVAGNHLSKKLQWREGDSSAGDAKWTVKNLFELKNARRVIVDGNLIEYNWPAAQNGFAILLTVRNQDGGAPWSVVEDVTFVNNLVRHVASGVNILGHDDNAPSLQTQRIVFRNNVFLDVGGRWGAGRLFQLLDGTRDVRIESNTAIHSGSLVFGGDHAAHEGFVFERNVAFHNGQGITGSGTASGPPTFARYFPDAIVRGNQIVGGDPSTYPPGNDVPTSLERAGVFGQADGAYRLTKPQCTARGIEKDCAAGADIEAVLRAAVRRASAQEPDRTGPEHGITSSDAAFWGAGALVAYVYFGYPLVAALRPRRRSHVVDGDTPLPAVSIIVVAFDEAAHIVSRLENLVAADYPADRREILVGSDGSTDGTDALARQFVADGVRVRAFRKRRGKAAVLNDLVAQASGDIIVFADARQSFAPDALRALVAPFADPTIGAVSGELILVDDRHTTATGRGAGFYWAYEKFIRSRESRAASMVGATGAIYAARRSLVESIPADTILDDVLIPVRIVRRGFRVVLERRARAYDRVALTPGQEYTRKVRTTAGTFQLFAREPWLLNPRANPVWFETLSHKAMRLILPAAHAALLVGNILLATTLFFQILLIAQLAFYGAAAGGFMIRHTARRPAVVAVPFAMCVLLWATVAGFARFATNRQRVTWERAADFGRRLRTPEKRLRTSQ